MIRDCVQWVSWVGELGWVDTKGRVDSLPFIYPLMSSKVWEVHGTTWRYMGTVIWEQLYGNNVERARHKLGIRKHNMSCCTSTCTQQSLPLGSSLQAYREETQTQAGLKAELSNLRNPHSKTGIHGFESQWVNYSKITSPYYLFTESSIYSLCELNSKLYL